VIENIEIPAIMYAYRGFTGAKNSKATEMIAKANTIINAINSE
jgi:hypothetical protein